MEASARSIAVRWKRQIVASRKRRIHAREASIHLFTGIAHFAAIEPHVSGRRGCAHPPDRGRTSPQKSKRGQPRRRSVEMGPKKEEIAPMSDTMARILRPLFKSSCSWAPGVSQRALAGPCLCLVRRTGGCRPSTRTDSLRLTLGSAPKRQPHSRSHALEVWPLNPRLTPSGSSIESSLPALRLQRPGGALRSRRHACPKLGFRPPPPTMLVQRPSGPAQRPLPRPRP